MFKAMTLFQFPRSYDFADLYEQLLEFPLKPVGALELSSRGFVPPFGEHEAIRVVMAHTTLLTIGGEDKILPMAAVRAEQTKRIKALAEQQGRMPGGKVRRRILEDVVHEFLPRAFVKPMRLNLAIFHDLGLVAIDTTSRKAAEEAISCLRAALGSFPAIPVTADKSIPSVLTSYINGDMPEGLTLGAEAWLQSPDEATVKVQHHDLSCDEITQHLEAGKSVTRLELYLDDHLSFVLDDYLTVRKLKFLDGAIDQLPDDSEDLQAELEARFALFDGEVRRLFTVLHSEFTIFETQDDDLA